MKNVFFVVLFLWTQDLMANEKLQKKIQIEIEKARACKTASDCAPVIAHCPFGCGVSVNKTQLDRIKKLFETYPSRCIYECIAYAGVDCVKGLCQALTPGTPKSK